MAWAVTSVLLVESLVFGLAALPAVLFFEWLWSWHITPGWLRIVVLSMALVPAYLVLVLGLIVLSPLAMRALGWRTPPNAAMRIADLEWPLLVWARYLISAHLVRLFAGTLLRATPLWSFYHRLNGARLGRGVYINSLSIMDDNLLAFGDGTVIGDAVHLSGHTVENGTVKTAAVSLGRNVTIGVGSLIGIGVEVGDGARVGALSVVPKHQRLAAGGTFGGVPVRRLDLVRADRS